MKTSNKIIAEFMGLEITKDKVIVPEMFQVEEHPFHLLKWIDDFREVDNLPPNSLNNLHFHSDWNWLMQVVEKILKDFYKLNPCPIYLKMNIEKALNEVNIDATYNSCVEFIKWYNENSAKEK